MIKAENIHLSYGNVDVLKGVDLEISKGEIISIVGASGAGKTTLLHILGTLEQADNGKYSINGESISELSSNKLSQFRNLEIGFIFQFHNLLAEFSAFENICLPGYISGRNKKEVEKEATKLLETLGISSRKDHMPNELSGGEQQRVAIARALVSFPKILIADEPTGNLDKKNSEEVINLIFKLQEEQGSSLIIVTHDQSIASQCSKTIKLDNGLIV